MPEACAITAHRPSSASFARMASLTRSHIPKGMCLPAPSFCPHRRDPAGPESAHAIHGAVKEAEECAETGEPRTILFCLSGHGHFDLASYDAYLSGKLEDVGYAEEEGKRALAELPEV